jgi:hypothetical protein
MSSPPTDCLVRSGVQQLVHPTDPGDDTPDLVLRGGGSRGSPLAPEQEFEPAPAVTTPAPADPLTCTPTGPALDFTPPSDLAPPADTSESDPNADVAETTDSDDAGGAARGGACVILIIGGILIAAALAAALVRHPGFDVVTVDDR